MKKISLFTLSIFLCFCASHTAMAQISMQVTIEGAYNNPLGYNITNDGRGVYVDGVNDVYAKAGDTGLTFYTKSQKVTSASRYIYYNFSSRIYTGDGGNKAPWTGLQKFQSRFHILNFTALTSDSSDPNFICPSGFVCGQDIDFPYHRYMETYGDSGQLSSGRNNYVLRFKSVNYIGVIDHPCSTSYLKLYHYNAVGGTPEKWVVTPKNARCTYNGIAYNGAIGALTLGTSTGNYGQYLMPFKLTITRK